ncbi:acetone carboxylase subunit gamma [Saccharopolyspora sp. NPDC002376]
MKCDCGQEFGDYRENWKLSALIRVRCDRESFQEIYPGSFACDPEWMEIREFVCHLPRWSSCRAHGFRRQLLRDR